MGITVLSAPAAITASTAGSTAALSAALGPALAADAAPIDFAALLTGQIAGLPQVTNNAVNTEPVREGKEDTAQDDDLIRDILSAQDPASAAQNALPNIPPALENRPQIDVDRNSQTASNVQLGIALVSDTQKATRGSASASTTLPELADNMGNPPEKMEPFIANSAPALQNNLPTSIKNDPLTANSQADAGSAQIKSTANPNQPALPSLSEITQTASQVTANLAAETNTGNTAPSTFATLMAGHTAQSQPAQHTAATGTQTITTPLQDNHWAQDFSERIVWVAKNDQQVAQINISPAQLGPVQITLNMNGDQASIAFASPHAEVRKAIEDALPNLREMLSTAGISLGQSNVGAQLQQQQRDTSPLFSNGKRSAGETAILPADSRSGSISTGLPIQRGRGMVDLFA
jgi:flagellar hook-length control protein FliK